MKKINIFSPKQYYPIRVMQFGEGNFLRGFIDYGIDLANELCGFNGGIVIIKPRPGNLEKIQKQDGVYTVLVRGIKNGMVYEEKRVITCIQKMLCAYEDYNAFMDIAKIDSLEFIVSNTTEAGIIYDAQDKFTDSPPKTYPAKLTKFLYGRFEHYHGQADKGLVILPLELSDSNGDTLKQYVLAYTELWQLNSKFSDWLENCNMFVNTLVDRIVTGYPSDAAVLMQKWGYEDKQIVACEPFSLWIIGDKRIAKRLPISTDLFKIKFTDDLVKYKEQKVRILNGAHTAIALATYLSGKNYIKECMDDKVLRKFIEDIVIQEIVPTINMPDDQASTFAKLVFERFDNPFIKHELLSIALNSVAKWRVRILPTIKDIYCQTGELPIRLMFSFAALIKFYRSVVWGDGFLIGKRAGEEFKIADNAEVLDFFQQISGKETNQYVKLVVENSNLWGEDLNAFPQFGMIVENQLLAIEKYGITACIKEMLT